MPAHASYDLTADHIYPVALGGAPWAAANVGVLCKACNGRKGASTPATTA